MGEGVELDEPRGKRSGRRAWFARAQINEPQIASFDGRRAVGIDAYGNRWTSQARRALENNLVSSSSLRPIPEAVRSEQRRG